MDLYSNRFYTNNIPSPTLLQAKYEEAEKLYRRAMSIAEATVGTNHQSYSITLNGLAGQLFNQVGARESFSLAFSL